MTVQEHQSEIVDTDGLLKHVGFDASMIHELLEIFQEYYPEQRTALQTAVNAGDSSEVREIAHTLKGALANFHAPKAKEIAKELEFAGRDGNVEQFHHLYESLDKNVEEVMTFLSTMDNS